MVQITTSPYTSNAATVGTIPSSAGDNKISFTFSNETEPPTSIFAYGYNATNNYYVWTSIDTQYRGNSALNQVTGTTQSTTSINFLFSYSDTDLITNFDGLSYTIELDQTPFFVENDTSGTPTILGHIYLFFIFPG
jgi:hypothetical protein